MGWGERDDTAIGTLDTYIVPAERPSICSCPSDHAPSFSKKVGT